MIYSRNEDRDFDRWLEAPYNDVEEFELEDTFEDYCSRDLDPEGYMESKKEEK